ncbi:MAG: zinc ribbon domain-containing protein, partial [Acidobacteria bacterium]|nr:zinc ribbon domain-containing protein [Acidobacteriota bacterium]
MQVYCPRCAAAAPQGQRFCKNCGLKLDIIVDAMEGRQVSFDPEALKEGLRTLGDNLRVGFETWKQEAKQTRRLKKEEVKKPSPHEWIGDLGVRAGQVGADLGSALGGVKNKTGQLAETRADRKLKQALAKKLPALRKYSLQQGITQILGGAASAGVWYLILRQMGRSGFLESIVQAIASKTEIPAVGMASVLQLLWLFALIPVATGFGHLINGIFFAAQPEDLWLDNYLMPPQPMPQRQVAA